jgi:hypothetical protein
MATDWKILSKLDSVLSLSTYAYWFLLFLGFAPGVLMAWLSSTVGWFWEAYGWFGITGVGILTWAVMMFGLAQFQNAVLRRAERRELLLAPAPTSLGSPAKAQRSVSFGLRKSTDNSGIDESAVGHIVRLDFWVKNLSPEPLDACRLKVEVSSMDFGTFERRFSGTLNPQEQEFIHGFEISLEGSRDPFKYNKFRKDRSEEFQRMPSLVDVEFAFSARDFPEARKSFYVTDYLGNTDRIIVSDSMTERDSHYSMAYSQ